MKIRFKNGYTVEVNDSYLKNNSKSDIIKRAKEIVSDMCKDTEEDGPMVIVKKIKTPNGFKVMIIKNNSISGIKRFAKDNEEAAQDFYDRLADKYNLDEEGYEDFGNTKIAARASYFNTEMQDSVPRKAKKVNDTPINFAEELGFAITPTTINRLVSKKDGHVLNPAALKKALNYLETDLDYDIEVRGPKWADPNNLATDPRVVDRIINKYKEFETELEKIDDTAFEDSVMDILMKINDLKSIVAGADTDIPDEDDTEVEEVEETTVEEAPVIEEPKEVKKAIKETTVTKTVEEPKTMKLEKAPKPVKAAPVVEEPVVEEEVVESNYADYEDDEIPLEDSFDDACEDSACEDTECEDTECDDVYIEDEPVAGATIHASVEGAPDHNFNKSMIVRGNSRALSEDPNDAKYGRRLLMGEFEDVKETLLYDIAHAGDVAAVTPKYLLHMGMEKYKEIVDLYKVPGLEAEYAELLKLYNKLFYNGYYLGVRGSY